MKAQIISKFCRPIAYILASFLLVLSLPASSSALDDSFKIGISASVQGEQTDILIPLRFSRFVVAPAISILHISDAVNDYGIGMILKQYLGKDKAVPYIAVRFGALIMDPSGAAKSVTDYIVGPAVGGEYFLDDHFSLAVEAQLNVSFSDKASVRFGNPDGTNINTASAFIATSYF